MDNKFLILLFYYDRPKMVRNALQSVKELNYKNWELAFIDDGSNKLFSPKLLNGYYSRLLVLVFIQIIYIPYSDFLLS